MASSVIISQYSITEEGRQEIAAHLSGEIEYLNVSNIVYSGYLNLIKQLRSVRCERVVIYLPSPQDQVMVPIFRVVALLISAPQNYVMKMGGELEKWTASMIAVDLLFFFWSFVRGLFLALGAGLYFWQVNRRGRVPVSSRPGPDNKRVLYLRPLLSHGLQVGGAISHSRGVIHGFLKNGYAVDCISDHELIEIPKGMGETIVVPPKYAYVVPRELNNFNYQHTFISFLKRRFVTPYKGLIYQRLSIGGFAGVFLSRLWGVPLILEYNGSEVWLAKNWGAPIFFGRLSQYIERSLLANAHVVVAVSEELRLQLLSMHIEESRIVMCPNGVDDANFRPDLLSPEERIAERQRLGFDDGDVIFTFVGSFGVWHGARMLAETINSIVEDSDNPFADRCKFLLIGNGVEFSAVHTCLKGAIQQDRVIMTGFIEQAKVPALLDVSDVCLVPTLENTDGSIFFGSPTKFFEYLAVGKPVIASAVGQLADIMESSPSAEDLLNTGTGEIFDAARVGDGIGVLYSAGNHAQLKAAILSMAESKYMRQIMGRNARIIAEKNHTWDQHVRRIMNAFDVVIVSEFNRPVRVLLNAIHSKSGGGVTYIRNMLPIMSKLPDIELHLFLHRSQEPLFADIIENTTTHYVDTSATLTKIIYTEQVVLPRLARELSCDVVFSTANYGPLMISNGVILLRNSLDVAIVERRAGKIIYWALIYIATISSLIYARRAIAVSYYASNASIRGVLQGLREKVSVIPHGISPDFQSIVRKKPDQPFVLTVSDIYVQKNLHTLIRGFAALLDETPELVLKIAGKPLDASYYMRICRVIDELGIAHAVKFLGHISGQELLDLYGSCSVFAFPSIVETFGNPLVEAMASGCPIVCARAAAMPEIAGDAVRYAAPEKAADFTRVLGEMLSDEGIRKDYGRRARERAKIYSWELTARETTDLLIDVARGK